MRVLNAARIPAAVVLAYVLLIFVLLPGNSVIGFPVHHDDYNNLSQVWTGIRWWYPIRPVSMLVLQLFSAAGIDFYYTALHVLIVTYATLVLTFLAKLFEIRRLVFVPLLAVAAVALSYEHVVEYAKYTGLITNLVSGIFGAGAMCLLIHESARERPRAFAFAGVVLLAFLSFWAKEDFLLPTLLVAAFITGEKWAGPATPRARKWAVILLAVLVCLAAALFLYNRSVHNVFTQSTSGVYKPDFHPLSIIETGWWYVRATPGASIAFAIQLSLLLINLVGLVPWRRLLLFHILVGAVALPYFCLPQHVNPYYSLNWTVWQAGGAILLLKAGRRRQLAYTGAVVLAAVAIFITQPGRAGIRGWYENQTNINRNVIATLRTYQNSLRDKPVIVIEQPPYHCPWFGHDGRFLRNHYGFNSIWVVRVPKNSEYLRVVRDILGTVVQGSVRTVAMEDEPLPANTPIVTFRPDGTGDLRYLAATSAASH